jgi:hypothetical protein
MVIITAAVAARTWLGVNRLGEESGAVAADEVTLDA